MSMRAAVSKTEISARDLDLSPIQDRADAAPRLRQAGADDLPASNHAESLQREVAAAIAKGVFDLPREEPPIEGKWSPRRTLAFMVGTCSVFWALVAWAAIKLF
jgi:hypothetical protein